MNDPLDDPIKQVVDEIDSHDDSGKSGKQPQRRDSGDLGDESDYTDPNRYWFVSTACPLIAGTFGPMASTFSICALSSGWRNYVPFENDPRDLTISIDDPHWLLITNGISLALALVANGALLLNMARRLRFSIAQPITIAGFFMASGFLIADIIILTVSPTFGLPADSPAAPASRHALASAFYCAIIAVVIYLVVTGLMCLSVWGAHKGHYARHFKLNGPQRTLMLQTMAFFAYILLGALVFSHVEGWKYLDAVYWADVTLLTVGLGDMAPLTHLGRSLFFPFAIGGIVILGLVIGSIRTLVLERGSKKISARMMEKKRLRAIDSVGNGKQRMRISRFQTIKFVESYTTTAHKREQEFRAMRLVQYCAERDHKWMSLAISLSAACILWLVGAAVFYVAQRAHGWTYFKAVYFSYVCLLTIGYGDLYPTSNAAKAFFILWSLLAVPTLTILISDMGDTVVAVFSSVTVWLESPTLLPGEQSLRSILNRITRGRLSRLDTREKQSQKEKTTTDEKDEDSETSMMDRIADRMAKHLEAQELQDALRAEHEGDTLDRDIHFYHFILARETQRMMKDLNATPPKRYEWGEWEYFLKLMANDYDSDELTGNQLIPEELRLPETREQWTRKQNDHRWSWLSSRSPLMGSKTSETEWILERLGACLEHELRESRLLPYRKREEKRKPPVSMADMVRRGRIKQREDYGVAQVEARQEA